MLLQDILSTITCGLALTDAYYPRYARTLSNAFGFSYFAYDSLYHNLKPDFLFHHVISSILLIVNICFPFSDENNSIFLKIEWSTLVLNMLNYTPDKFKPIVQACFFISFFKFRIYNWYMLFQNHTLLPVQLIPLLGLYTLNLYWFTLLCKKASASLKKINLNVLNHHICSYTMLANSGLIVYTVYPDLTFIQVMSVLLGISSYLYHQEIALYFNGIPSIKSKWIMFDAIIFHTYHAGYIYLIGDFYGKISWYFHLFNVSYIYIFNHEDVTSLSMVSFGIDIIYLLCTTPTIHLFTVAILIICIHLMNPFYDMSFVSTHLLICWYAYTRSLHLLQLNSYS
jgi:hypothetical protein